MEYIKGIDFIWYIGIGVVLKVYIYLLALHCIGGLGIGEDIQRVWYWGKVLHCIG